LGIGERQVGNFMFKTFSLPFSNPQKDRGIEREPGSFKDEKERQQFIPSNSQKIFD